MKMIEGGRWTAEYDGEPQTPLQGGPHSISGTFCLKEGVLDPNEEIGLVLCGEKRLILMALISGWDSFSLKNRCSIEFPPESTTPSPVPRSDP